MKHLRVATLALAALLPIGAQAVPSEKHHLAANGAG